jgi:hypothetical protein
MYFDSDLITFAEPIIGRMSAEPRGSLDGGEDTAG